MEREEAMKCGAVARAPRDLGNFGVTVSGLQTETEDSVIGKEQWRAIQKRRTEGNAPANPASSGKPSRYRINFHQLPM